MAAALTSRRAYDLYASTAAGAATSYFFTKAVPVPNRNFLVVVGTVDTLVEFALVKIVDKICYELSARAGYIGTPTSEGLKGNKINNYKFFRFGSVVTISATCLLPIFYRYLGRPLGLQLPNYLTTAMCIIFVGRAGEAVLHLGYAFFPLPKLFIDR